MNKGVYDPLHSFAQQLSQLARGPRRTESLAGRKIGGWGGGGGGGGEGVTCFACSVCLQEQFEGEADQALKERTEGPKLVGKGGQ